MCRAFQETGKTAHLRYEKIVLTKSGEHNRRPNLSGIVESPLHFITLHLDRARKIKAAYPISRFVIRAVSRFTLEAVRYSTSDLVKRPQGRFGWLKGLNATVCRLSTPGFFVQGLDTRYLSPNKRWCVLGSRLQRPFMPVPVHQTRCVPLMGLQCESLNIVAMVVSLHESSFLGTRLGGVQTTTA
jgi:hypothetical protein